jgi:hypothetical protein
VKTSKTSQEVLLAPVPCVHLESAATMPRIAFGTSQSTFKQQFESKIGIPVYIYASQPPHHLFSGPAVSWKGELVEIVRANDHGKHSDPSVRPPSTLANDASGDGPFHFFWEVAGLHQIEKLSLSKFNWKGGGGIPQWPVLAELDFGAA